jgi:hypothetical protein
MQKYSIKFSQTKSKSTSKMIIHHDHDQVGFIPWMQGWFSICKYFNIIHYINKLRKKKKTPDHLIRCLESICQNPTSLLGNIRNTRSIPKYNKSNLQQISSQHQTKWRETWSNPTKTRDYQGYPFSPFLSNIVLEVLARAIRQQN